MIVQEMVINTEAPTAQHAENNRLLSSRRQRGHQCHSLPHKAQKTFWKQGKHGFKNQRRPMATGN